MSAMHGDPRSQLAKLRVLSARDQAQIASLNAKLAESRTACEQEVERAVADMKRRLDEAEVRAREAERDRDAAMEESGDTVHRMRTMAEEAAASRAEASRLRQRLEEAQREHSTAEEKLRSLQKQLHLAAQHQMENEQQQRSADAEAKQRQLESAQHEKERQRLQSLLDEHRDMLDEVRAERDSEAKRLLSEFESLRQNQARLEVEVLNAKAGREKSETELSNLQVRMRTLLAENAELKGSVEAANARQQANNDTQQSQLQMEQERNCQLEAELMALRQQLSDVEKQHEQTEVKVTTAVEDLRTVKAERDAAIASRMKAEESEAAARSQLDSLRDDHAAAIRELEQQLAEQRGLHASRAAQSLARLERLRLDLMQAEQRCTTLNNEAEASAVAHKEELRSCQSKHDKEKDRLQQMLNETESRVASLTEQLHDRESELSTVTSDLHRLQLSERRHVGMEDELGSTFKDLQSARRQIASFEHMQSELKVCFAKLVAFESSIEPALTCTVCLQLFTQPISMPCGHTVCKKCAKHTKTSKNDASNDSGDDSMVICPECTPSSSVRFPLSHISPANNLQTVQGKLLYLQQVLNSLKTHTETKPHSQPLPTPPISSR